MHWTIHNYQVPIRDGTKDGISKSTIEAFRQAYYLDPLGYMFGIKSIRIVPDSNKWNAQFDNKSGAIILQRKFEAKDLLDKVQTLLHEAGHWGQYNDPITYSAFKKAGLNRKDFFLDIANNVHRQDYEANGIDNIAEEVFAESYARFALQLPLPQKLRDFWAKRAD